MAITARPDRNGWTGSPYLGSDTSSEVPWIVYTTSLDERETAILASGVLPPRGEPHPDNAYMAAFSLKLKREKDQPLVWRATVTYKTDSLDEKEKEKQSIPNPIERPAEITWDAVSYTRPVLATVENYTPPGGTLIEAGTPILNSAYDQFDPPPEITEYRWVANVTKMVEAVPTWLLEMPGRINNAPFVIDGLTVETRSARMIGMRIGKRARENGVNYRELSFTLEFREKRESRFSGDSVPEPYILELLNEGYNYDTGTVRGRIRVPAYIASVISDTGDKCPHPVLLDAIGLPIEEPDFETAVFLPFSVYRSADFSVLPLAA